MSFKVYRNESDPFEQFGDDDRFDIIEGGVLKIHRQDGTITYINPASWASIDDSPAPSVYGSPAHSSSGDVPPERAALLITTELRSRLWHRLTSTTRGGLTQCPRRKKTTNVLKELGVYAAQGRIEVLTLDGDGFAVSLVVGPTIPIAVSYID